MKLYFLGTTLLLQGTAGSSTPLEYDSDADKHVPGSLRGLYSLQNNGTVANGTIPVDDSNATAIADGAKEDQLGNSSSACCAGKGSSKSTKGGSTDGNFLTLTFKYIDGNCSQSDNQQTKGSCEGEPGDNPTITINKGAVGFTKDPPGDPIEIDDQLTFAPTGNELVLTIGGQELNIHTSCADFLFLGDIYGSLQLIGYGLPTPQDLPPECDPPPAPPTDCINDIPGGAQDTNCDAFKPICEEKDDEENECRVCVNDKPGGLQDSGCTEGCKVCVGLEDDVEVDLEHGDFGDLCKVCQDDAPLGGQDSGCSFKLPICAVDSESSSFAATYAFGDDCVKCIDDSFFFGVSSGCDHKNPVCFTEGGSSYGEVCIPCIIKDDASSSSIIEDENSILPHKGCTVEAPYCNAPDGRIGTGCFFCKNDMRKTTVDGTEKDTGCPEGGYPACVAPFDGFGDTCALCVNDRGVLEIDDGCIEQTPVCFADYLQGGETCVKCVNDRGIARIDSGCSEDKKYCGAKTGEPGKECFECASDDDCVTEGGGEREFCLNPKGFAASECDPGTCGVPECVSDEECDEDEECVNADGHPVEADEPGKCVKLPPPGPPDPPAPMEPTEPTEASPTNIVTDPPTDPTPSPVVEPTSSPVVDPTPPPVVDPTPSPAPSATPSTAPSPVGDPTPSPTPAPMEPTERTEALPTNIVTDPPTEEQEGEGDGDLCSESIQAIVNCVAEQCPEQTQAGTCVVTDAVDTCADVEQICQDLSACCDNDCANQIEAVIDNCVPGDVCEDISCLSTGEAQAVRRGRSFLRRVFV